jgi:hypothetical protein
MANPHMARDISLGREAYNVALKKFKAAHADELETLLGDERESRGLPRVRLTQESPQAIRAKIERAQARIAKYKRMLGDA